MTPRQVVSRALLFAVVGCSGGAATPNTTFDAGADAAIEGFGDAADDASDDVAGATDTRAPGTATGTVKGKNLVVADAIAIDFSAEGDSLNGVSTVIVLSDRAGICAREASSTGAPNRRFLVIFLSVYDAGGKGSPATQPGTFAAMENTTVDFAPNQSIARVFLQETDGLCFNQLVGEATGGTVELTSVDAENRALEGTFTAEFPGGDVLSGGFFATRCPALNPNRTPLKNCL